MGNTEVILICSLVTMVGVIVSVISAVFVAGSRWGSVNSEMRYMNDRLAKIEGMFTLTPKEVSHD